MTMEWIDLLFAAIGAFLGWYGKVVKDKLAAWAKGQDLSSGGE